MKTNTFALALGCLLAFSSFVQVNSQALSNPGSLYVSLSVPSISNIVGLLATILPSYLVNNKTLNLDISDSGLLYNIKFNAIHINTLNINERQIDFVPGTKKVRINFGGIDLDSQLDGSMTFIGIIPLYAAALKIKGLKVQADLEAIPMRDEVHWQLTQATFVDLEDVTITTTSSVWNAMISPFHGAIKDLIRSQLPKIQTAIQTVVDDLNIKLKQGGNNFMTNVFNPRFPLNLTTTHPPLADNQTKTVTLNFDGTFFDTVHGTNHVKPNTNNPLRIKGLNSNQVFIHQTMIASLLIALSKQYMPLDINDVNTTNQILQLFPEISDHYGETIETDLIVNLLAENGDVLHINQYTGIEIGKGQEKLAAQLIVRCKNAQMSDFETAVQFDLGLEAIANITINSQWKVFLNIPNVAISNVKITHDKVGMIARRYDNLLTSVLRSAINNINSEWSRPFDITTLDPQILPFLSNMLTNLHVSPFYQNEFYYFGFSYFVDPAPQTKASFNHLSNQITLKHSDKLYKLFDIINNWFTKINTPAAPEADILAIQ